MHEKDYHCVTKVTMEGWRSERIQPTKLRRQLAVALHLFSVHKNPQYAGQWGKVGNIETFCFNYHRDVLLHLLFGTRYGKATKAH